MPARHRSHPHLVPCHHLPLLRPHQLRRRVAPSQLHCLHHSDAGALLTYRAPSAQQNAAEKPPFFLPSWTAMYAVNAFVVGVGAGGGRERPTSSSRWDNFGLFAKCYQCPKTRPPATLAPKQRQ
ncbi:unnamed protein product [Musa acuminata subsp. malaccensis]|uniref:(wild Malaysian banana) hypothetical protein n=1 Tax=Musa acuminata subsp. malaccensis TaxID=214687 RepID=A0A804KT01_MUSAM|nr:unnamed protein product [Musa acuminata subsp. malaccensis]